MSASESSVNEEPVLSKNARFLELTQKCRSLAADLRVYEDLSDPQDLPAQIKADIQEMEALKTQYSEASVLCLTLAELLAPDQKETLESERTTFMMKYKTIRNTLLARLPPPKQEVVEKRSPPEYKLPNLDLPKFGGKFAEWTEFKEMFKSIVLDRSDLDPQAKYHYLRTSLEADALNQIKRLPFSGVYLETAWNILLKYYDNRSNELNEYLNAIYNAKNIATLSGPNKVNAFRELITTFRQHASGLDTLFKQNPEVDAPSQILIFWFLLKCDKRVRIEWNREIKRKSSLPNFGEFLEFVDAACSAEEQAMQFSASTSEQSKSTYPASMKRNTTPKTMKKSSVAAVTMKEKKKEKKCLYCDGTEHYITSCEKFRELPAKSRVEIANDKKLCKFCLRPHCNSRNCFRRPCRTCKEGHNTLLHLNEGKKHFSKYTIPIVASAIFSPILREPILATAVVTAFSKDENLSCDSRVLLDSASQINIITSSLAKRLNLPFYNESQSVVGVGNQSRDLLYRADLVISSKYTNVKLSISCSIMEEIISLVPNLHFPVEKWNIPNRCKLADPHFNSPAGVDLLLGSTIFWKVLKLNQFRLGKNLPKLQETDLGWIIADDLKFSTSESSTSLVSVRLVKSNLENLIERFWTIEEGTLSKKSSEEFDYENFYLSTVSKAADGRFIVQLPFKESPERLGNSESIALRRFKQLETSLSRNPDLKSKYSKIIREYIELGHLKKVTDIDLSNSALSYYVPHHVVIKETSTSTPERVVFDFSMKTSSGFSLNDLLSKGEVVQPDLFATLLRFRLKKYVLTADIKKMYRQIWVDKRQTVFQRIFWRESSREPIETYELQTVTFGMTCSPYLVTRSLQKIADDLDSSFTEVKSAILHAFYMDDMLWGHDNLKIAKKTRDQLIGILAKCGFELTKWSSNREELINDLPVYLRESQQSLFIIGEKHTIKTLGVLWAPFDDTFQVWLHLGDISKIRTKRQVLSAIAALYDPIGLVAPVICKAKIFMQMIWTCKSKIHENKALEWDELLPESLISLWLDFASRLHCLNSRPIPRFIFSNLIDEPEFIELHGFCDASEVAIGCVIYLRAGSRDNISVHLLCSKSRVAPTKNKQTIPRLELSAALLLSELVDRVLNHLNLSCDIRLVRLWSDSTIALSWLRKPASSWQTYVANRVQKIQNLTSNCIWDHIRGTANPADCLSRGSDADKLINNDLWWKGPEFLSSTSEPWSSVIEFTKTESVLPDHKKLNRIAAFNIQKNHLEFKIFSRFSNYINPNDKITGFLTTQELDLAINRLVWLAQRQTFATEIHLLTHKRDLPPKSRLLTLSPFIDEHGILRVGGRLSQSNLSYRRKHPMLLSNNHPFSYLIVHYEHLRLLHAGQRLITSAVRRQFWILRIDSVTKKCLQQCLKCLRAKGDSHSQFMANLPQSRVTPHRPFSVVGVDYTGAFSYVETRGRGRKQILKAYIAVFVCFATKAVHLELVTDLSTPTFLAALDRFISRRGFPSKIKSDNGTNFVGAASDLEKLKEFFEKTREKIDRYATNKGIDWSFIPPFTPSFGGLWEAGVKSAKHPLYIAMGNAQYSFEQLATICAQIEACLNSRPLYAESLDPNDVEALTPGHFLIGQALTALPKPDLSSVPTNRLKYWDVVQKTVQQFWKRWSAEYLNTLQQRYKWRIEKRDLQEGEIVLIKDTSLPPTKWPLAKIIELHPGEDGHVRVVTLKTTNSIIKRSISKIIPLPIV